MEDLALEVLSNGLDVILKDRLQLFCCVVVGCDPWRELRVPDKSVSSNLLVVLHGPSDQVVSRPEVEDTWLRLDGLPFDSILMGDLSKFLRNGDFGIWSIPIENPLICSYQRN